MPTDGTSHSEAQLDSDTGPSHRSEGQLDSDRRTQASTEEAILMLESVQAQMLDEVGHVREAIRILRDGRPASPEGESPKEGDAFRDFS